MVWCFGKGRTVYGLGIFMYCIGDHNGDEKWFSIFGHEFHGFD
jgi:hypothetical protein